MDEKHIAHVASVLQKWNPLGPRADQISDLEGYRTEAIDIIANLGIFPGGAANIVRDTLNGAFQLTLTTAECVQPANEILLILKNKT